jgi:hypothetical protein
MNRRLAKPHLYFQQRELPGTRAIESGRQGICAWKQSCRPRHFRMAPQFVACDHAVSRGDFKDLRIQIKALELRVAVCTTARFLRARLCSGLEANHLRYKGSWGICIAHSERSAVRALKGWLAGRGPGASRGAAYKLVDILPFMLVSKKGIHQLRT